MTSLMYFILAFLVGALFGSLFGWWGLTIYTSYRLQGYTRLGAIRMGAQCRYTQVRAAFAGHHSYWHQRSRGDFL